MMAQLFCAARDTLTEAWSLLKGLPKNIAILNIIFNRSVFILSLRFTATLLKNSMTDYELYEIE
jgi:hypothetical protein